MWGGMKRGVFAFALVAVAVAAAWLLWPAREHGADDVKPPVRSRLISSKGHESVARSRIDSAMHSLTNGAAVARRVRIRPTGGPVENDWVDENGKPWPKEQIQLMRKIYDTAEADDLGKLVQFSDAVLECPNPEIREKFVDELGWFGEKAFESIIGFLSDPNDDVVAAARTHLVDSFQEIDDDADKAAILTLVSKAIRDDDVLDVFADELMSMDELLALQTIADVMDTGTDQAKKAMMSMYETITDEKWDGVDKAEEWLQNNYSDDGVGDDSSVGESHDYGTEPDLERNPAAGDVNSGGGSDVGIDGGEEVDVE